MDTEQKRKNIERTVMALAAIGVGLFVAPFIFLAIKGLIGLIIASVVAVTTINFIPWFSAKLANWKLKAIKHEASQNPVETLQNEYSKRQDELSAFGNSIRKFEGEVNIFEDKIDGYSKAYPEETASFASQLSKMKQLLKSRWTRYSEAKKNLDLFSIVIDKAKVKWDIANAALAATNASGIDTVDFMSKIQTETALDSVQRSMSMAFADLEFSLREDGEVQSQKDMVNSTVKQPIVQQTVRQSIS